MGNLCSSCFSPKSVRQKKKRTASKRLLNSSSGGGAGAGGLPAGSSNRWSRMRSSRKEKVQDALIHEQAVAAAILFQQHQRNGGSLPFDRSASLRFPAGPKKNSLPRSSSSRARSLTDPLLQPQQLVNQVCLFVLEFFIVEFDISLV